MWIMALNTGDSSYISNQRRAAVSALPAWTVQSPENMLEYSGWLYVTKIVVFSLLIFLIRHKRGVENTSAYWDSSVLN